jgi:hypothetical protein
MMLRSSLPPLERRANDEATAVTLALGDSTVKALKGATAMSRRDTPPPQAYNR